MAMAGVAIFAMMLFLGMLFYNIQRINNEKKEIVFRDFSYAIQNEFNLANRVQNGYYREFVLPDAVEGIAYSITINSNNLVITTNNQNFYEMLPNLTVNSNLVIGLNKINKTNGTIYLN